MVEAIEDLFVPVLIYNNKQVDAAIVKKFEEPTWNNPVVRFVNSEGNDVIARQDNIWSVAGVANRMATALEAAGRDIPDYLQSLGTDSSKLELATFAMHCYWEGEGSLGSIDGVVNTHSAWIGNLEVVELLYDPAKVEYGKLVDSAKKFECASKVYAHSDDQLQVAKDKVGKLAVEAPEKSRAAKLSDQKYYLRNTPGLRNLPLTRMQSTKVNSALGQRQDPTQFLSPRQLSLLEQIAPHVKPESAKNMSEYVFPEDDAKLAKYWADLVAHLELTKQP